MLLMIDNYDSFTYNLVQYLGELGATINVVRNDQIKLDEIRDLDPKRIVVSPGPGEPEDGGISNDVIREFGSKIPTPLSQMHLYPLSGTAAGPGPWPGSARHPYG